ncbi:unnamed protein product [Spirodela intermedia]|uniref:Uncharacterized protein n=1 Tax=Spirodela intermedia TaxID=51605 RepID=A0A7I8J3L8_SPIIN|nr:unnamed protein product [Spirodela intermedia]CAA6663950.1 unnamed protein product [Spirodela intermedia]
MGVIRVRMGSEKVMNKCTKRKREREREREDLYLRRRGDRGVSLHDLARLVDQELGEVPLDAVAEEPALLDFKNL